MKKLLLAYLVITIYYLIALLLKATYQDSIVKYYSVALIPIIFLSVAFTSIYANNLKDALKRGLVVGLLFAATATALELITFHLLADFLQPATTIIFGDFTQDLKYYLGHIAVRRLIVYMPIFALGSPAIYFLLNLKKKKHNRKK